MISSKIFITRQKFTGMNNITRADTMEDFEKLLDGKGGFISAHWDGTAETEEKIKELTKATIRCIPLNNTKKKEVVF